MQKMATAVTAKVWNARKTQEFAASTVQYCVCQSQNKWGRVTMFDTLKAIDNDVYYHRYSSTSF